MPALFVSRIKEETAGKSKLELAVVGTTALLLAGGFLFLGVHIP